MASRVAETLGRRISCSISRNWQTGSMILAIMPFPTLSPSFGWFWVHLYHTSLLPLFRMSSGTKERDKVTAEPLPLHLCLAYFLNTFISVWSKSGLVLCIPWQWRNETFCSAWEAQDNLQQTLKFLGAAVFLDVLCPWLFLKLYQGSDPVGLKYLLFIVLLFINVLRNSLEKRDEDEERWRKPQNFPY